MWYFSVSKFSFQLAFIDFGFQLCVFISVLNWLFLELASFFSLELAFSFSRLIKLVFFFKLRVDFLF